MNYKNDPLNNSDVKEIVLTEVVGKTHTSDDPVLPVNDIEVALAMLQEKQICEIYIGGRIHGRFSANGVIRRWNEDAMVTKIINHLGQEGSGCYTPLNAPNRAFIDTILDNATLHKGGMYDRFQISKGLPGLEADVPPVIMVR